MAALIKDVYDIAETLSSLSLESSEETDNTMNISTNQKVPPISPNVETLRLAPDSTEHVGISSSSQDRASSTQFNEKLANFNRYKEILAKLNCIFRGIVEILSSQKFDVEYFVIKNRINRIMEVFLLNLNLLSDLIKHFEFLMTLLRRELYYQKSFLENLMVSGRLVIHKLEKAKINVENCFKELSIRLNIHNFPENIDSSSDSVLMTTNSSEIEIWKKIKQLLLQSQFDCIQAILEAINDFESFVRKFND
ncbi:hypothetical protein CDAR_200811 [Caerostris darwini]|uniref:Uncharacterized protein n=1 Tax=Caerostris darwini TaxID=1538125 RepID=A0AAV4SAG6_9ARAC|nr:hypothetical protein CDAR_34821 [Caerostris darwini]GIY40645.1 hypothetical protein CDAR_200811 [Caerostris darwini]